MRREWKFLLATIALAIVPVVASGCAFDEEVEAQDELGEELGEESAEVPRHAVMICRDASFFKNYDSSSGPANFLYTMYEGDKIGHTPGAHPVHNGWAATFDFGKGQWGFVRIGCIGKFDSW
jgi:hypothetical protein